MAEKQIVSSKTIESDESLEQKIKTKNYMNIPFTLMSGETIVPKNDQYYFNVNASDSIIR